MDASNIISDDMTLEEKLKAIEDAVSAAKKVATGSYGSSGVPVDPANLTICDGCE